MALKSPSLFWRTFTLLMLLLIITALAWLQSFRVLSEVPFSKGVSQQIVSTVNLTRYALISSDPNTRPDLLHILAYREGVRILPKESNDSWKPLVAQGSIAELIETQTKEVLGQNTIVAGMVNDEPGVWVSMEIEGDDYWLLIRSDLLDPPFGTAWIWWAFVAFLVGTMGATVLTQRTVRPLAELSAAAKKLGRGEKPDPLPENTRTAEIEAVNRSFNHMVEELERMEDDRELLLAGVSHDLRTPLTRMRLEIELSNLSEDSRDAMVSDLEQMESIVNQFMAYAKRSKQPLERVDLGAAVYGTIDDMRLRTKDDVRIETSIMGNLFVMAHPTELVRAIQNLLVNADRYGRTQENGLLDLNIQVLRQGEEAVLRICDKGVGIPQEEMDRVVRPFERGDTARGGAKGAGLGLAIVVRVVKRSGGRIILSSNHPHGLIVELIMPLANKRNEKPALEEQTAPTDTLLPRQDP
ncbi:MAG TPA: HAMP domain-containing protein [Candidatus Aphodousia faecavium]|uniref:histidine kinase n=1 Tax=Parasutterella secunda TaxID=626947 RepID=A0ABS2GUE6_9BURK|nr:ATP-binding protein [Parasutterella secunda]MBM6928342.1 HAMP domain-containing protein [Parasutterella secunda]HIT95630.1 HAMP domain-containing protein [Candidatus Aphodousia faecavium]